MLNLSSSNSFLFDVNVESEVQQRLIEHFTPIYKDRSESYVATLMDPDHHTEQLNYIKSVVREKVFTAASSLLVSGFSAGSEMIAARWLGFGEIYGVEVDPFLQEICQQRLSAYPGMYPVLYDGSHLPYQDVQFTLVTSSHIIEHTLDPALYLFENMRVLKDGGYLFLEFPHRYHHIELHTQVLSFEWMPRPIRNAVLRALRSRYSPLKSDVKKLYNDILVTNLQQISLGGVKRMLHNNGFRFTIIHHFEVVPGIIRCVIQKGNGFRNGF